MKKILWSGQISSLFAVTILSLRHFFVMPAKDYLIVLFVLLIGFIPSIVYYYTIKRFAAYITVINALIIVSSVYFLMDETALGGVFLLVPVLSLLFKSQKLYFFSAISSISIYLIFTEDNPSPGKLVILLDHMTIFLIMVFLIFLVVRELIQNTKTETKQLHTIMSLSRSVEARDEYTNGHSERVAQLGQSIAEFIPELNPELVYQTGIIHDVGKLTTPDHILLKKGRLTDQEYKIMKNHTNEGASICKSLGIPDEFIKGVLYHHERWDGSGYPRGLAGEEIPLIARVLCIADAIDAMSSNRSYRSAMDFISIRKEIQSGVGTQFDPNIAKIILDNWNYLIEMTHKNNLKKYNEKVTIKEVMFSHNQ